MKNESVFYINRSDLENQFNFQQQYWTVSENQLISLPYHFAPRSQLENDPTKKQLIPYALLFNENGHVLCYSRNGTEKRLSQRKSVGFGGHVNDKDYGSTLLDIQKNGLLRELKEEIGLQISASQLKLLGLINEEISEVGHSHTGLVFKIDLQSSNFSFDSEIASPHWESIKEIQFEQFELWSSLALKLVR